MSMQDRARREIARLEREISDLENRGGVVEGQGINEFVSSSSRDTERRRRIQGARNAITSLREMYNV